MVIIPSPPYFIQSFTIWSAPAAFLFLSLPIHLFTSSLVHSLCNPYEPLSSLSDAPTFACTQASISFSNSASNVSFVVGVPGLRWYSTSTSLFPFEQLTTLPLCALNADIPVSASPACLPSIPYIRTHIWFIPPSKSSFLLFTIFSFLSSYNMFLPPCRSFIRCISCVCLSLFSYRLFCFLIPPFTSLLYTINFSPIALLGVLSTKCSHPSIILAVHCPIIYRSLLYLCFPTARYIALHSFSFLLGTLGVFFHL